jgi:hypothetical protein
MFNIDEFIVSFHRGGGINDTDEMDRCSFFRGRCVKMDTSPIRVRWNSVCLKVHLNNLDECLENKIDSILISIFFIKYGN